MMDILFGKFSTCGVWLNGLEMVGKPMKNTIAILLRRRFRYHGEKVEGSGRGQGGFL